MGSKTLHLKPSTLDQPSGSNGIWWGTLGGIFYWLSVSFLVSAIAFYILDRESNHSSTLPSVVTPNLTADDSSFEDVRLEVDRDLEETWLPVIKKIKSSYSELDGPLTKVSAILISWKRLTSLKLVVRHLSIYPYIGEILIWNNNPSVHLTHHDFGFSPLVRLYNPGDNLHDFSKQITCSLAKYDICYFQDDDWLNRYMDSLYTNFLRSPNLIHTNTMPIIHLEHRRWQFQNEDLNIHTGFAWMGCGSFVPKSMATRFLRQLGVLNLGREELLLADMFFTIFSNQYPYQLSNPLTALDQRQGWSTSVDQWTIVYGNILKAARTLYSRLLRKDVLFNLPEAKPYQRERDARAPCLNDQCLFLTNIQPFPYADQVTFRNQFNHIHDLEAKFNALDFPTNTYWDQYAYHHAVDNNMNTAWNSFHVPRAGSFVGLHLIRSQRIDVFGVWTSWTEAYAKQVDFVVEVSFSAQGQQWLQCPADLVFKPGNEGQPNYLLFQHFQCDSKHVHMIRLTLKKDASNPLVVFGFQINDVLSL